MYLYIYMYICIYVCIYIYIYDAGLPHPPSPPHPMVSPPPPLWGGACGALCFRRCGGLCTPTQLRLWLALFAVVPAAVDTAHDVVL